MTAAPRRLQNSDQRREVNCCRLVGMNVPTGEPEQVSLKGQQNIFLVLAWVLFNLSSVLQVTAPVSQE